MKNDRCAVCIMRVPCDNWCDICMYTYICLYVHILRGTYSSTSALILSFIAF